MIFKRDFAVINGDNINGIQLLEEEKVVDLILADIPTTLEGDWKRSIEKRIKMANKVISSTGVFALLVNNKRFEQLKEILDEQVGQQNFVLSCEWEDESLLVYGKANVYDNDRIEAFLEEVREIERYDKKLKKRLEFKKVRNTKFLKAIILTFSEPDGEILDMYAGCGMTGVAIWELNFEKDSIRTFTLINFDEDSTCSSVLYPHIYKQSLIYEEPFDYVILDNE